ncbi:hypothetical protein IP91_02940 [Pseudoduganella lurida]|uniref:Uncharacterized protein n=1 Tax=Pseudoduganella lurida TaxID=1036180 RepID=A0A562RAV7_9BURK|nr:protealysin inhibitor emfourin [Pseudoduganella lurida]TWI65530.1 hypothetical protein IP91_02940 [Pseudoduganella lurida]
MKITATNGGGFAGITRSHEVDTAASPAGAALEAALAASPFFAAAVDGVDDDAGKIGADIPHWNITVEDGGRRHSVRFADDGSPAAARWRGLLDRILAA